MSKSANKSVTVIPALATLDTTSSQTKIKKRVTAYARVSTDSEEQQTSYEAQVDYYTRHIQENPEWEFVRIYTDEGISAVNTKKRDGFNEMVADALAGKFDLLLTKSVSRFARNTVDSLQTVRALKEKGVEIYFEKENIYTLDAKGELLITIMSSLAQEESRSLSENVAWGHRKRMADGKVTLPYKRFLGYEKGEDDLPKIVESEAETVRLIYRLFLEGRTYTAIAAHLTEMSIPTPGGKEVWSQATIRSILKNEKYKGDALLQKKFIEDFLTKKQRVNKGELPQYYVENSHPAIIQPETFDLVQVEMKRRRERKHPPRSSRTFSLRIICGKCGGFYTPKIWHSKKSSRKEIWQCHYKYAKRTFCSTPHVSEDFLKQTFVSAFNQILGGKQQLMEDYAVIIEALTDTTKLDEGIAELRAEEPITLGLIKSLVEENARTASGQGEYQKRYEALVARYEKSKAQLEALASEKAACVAKRENIRHFLDTLSQSDDLLTEFDENLWNTMGEQITIHAKDHIVVTFRDGSSVNI